MTIERTAKYFGVPQYQIVEFVKKGIMTPSLYKSLKERIDGFMAFAMGNKFGDMFENLGINSTERRMTLFLEMSRYKTSHYPLKVIL
jgi:hypothetical protein